MTEELTEAWGRAVAELAGDRTVRAGVVTGEGRAFCAGGDLSWLGAGDQEAHDLAGGSTAADVTAGAAKAPAPNRLRDRMLPFYRTWLSIRDLEVPAIAALNGAAIG